MGRTKQSPEVSTTQVHYESSPIPPLSPPTRKIRTQRKRIKKNAIATNEKTPVKTQKTEKKKKSINSVVQLKSGKKKYEFPCYEDKDLYDSPLISLTINKTMDDDFASDTETVQSGKKLCIRDFKEALALYSKSSQPSKKTK